MRLAALKYHLPWLLHPRFLTNEIMHDVPAAVQKKMMAETAVHVPKKTFSQD